MEKPVGDGADEWWRSRSMSATSPESRQVSRRIERWRQRAPWVVIVAFGASGVVHLVHPSTFTRMVPTFLPAKTALVYASGVAELVCAAGLSRRAPWARVASAALLLVIWPANLQDAINAQRADVLSSQIERWVRFPLQIPLIWCALQARPRRTSRPESS